MAYQRIAAVLPTFFLKQFSRLEITKKEHRQSNSTNLKKLFTSPVATTLNEYDQWLALD